MPFLNKDNTDGFVHCLFRRNLTPQDAHSYLTEYLGQEKISIEEVTALFKKFEDGTFKSEYPEKILLVEKLKFTKHSVMEFCDLFQGNFHINNFEETSGMKNFLKAVSLELKKRNESEHAATWNYYTRDFLHGFIQCLKSQGKKQEEINADLKELTLREVFTSEDVEEVFNVDEDVLVKMGYDFSELPRHLIENALDFVSIDSRVNIRSTCSLFNEIENTIDYEISCVHLRFEENGFQLRGDGKIAEKQYESVGIVSLPSNYRVYLVHENGNVWMDTGSEEHQFKKLWNVMAHTPRCIIRDFKISFSDMFEDTKKLAQMLRGLNPLFARNLYFYDGQVQHFKELMKKFEPTMIEKIAIFFGFSLELDDRLFTLAQFSGVKEFVTNMRCSSNSLEYFGGLKFARFKIDTVYSSKILEFKNKLLAQETDFREIKFENHLFDYDFDAINIELGTFNKSDTEFPRFAEFPYPPPNENKVLKLAVLKDFCWFRGPGWRCGEMEEVERELDANSDIEEVVTRGNDFSTREYMGKNGVELEEEPETSVNEPEVKENDDEPSSHDQDVADGLLFGMFRQHFTAINAHANIVQYFGPAFMNIMQVRVLFRRFEEGNYEILCPERLLLVENNKIKKHGVFGFCEFYNYYDFEGKQGMEIFCEVTDDQIEKRDKWKFHNRGFLRGYIHFLKSQGKSQEEIYNLVMGLTKKEFLSMDDISEDFNINKDTLIASSVQLVKPFEHNNLEEMSSVYCNSHGKGFRFIIEPEMIEINYEFFTLGPRTEYDDYRDDETSVTSLIYENGDVWISRSEEKLKYDYSRFSKAWKLLQRSKSTIENLSLSVSQQNTKEMLKVFQENGHLHVKNAYFYCKCDGEQMDDFDSVYIRGLAPGVLKKIAVYCDGWVGEGEEPFFFTEQFLKAEEFIANGQCHIPEDASLAHLKFGRFKVGWIKESEIIAWKEQLLTKPIDFRELKFEVGALAPGNDPDGQTTFDFDFPPVDIESLRFEKLAYPEPNQDKFIELAVANNHFFWFRGPGRIPGEMERAEKEMELNKPVEDDHRKTENLPMHQGCFEEKVYTLEEGFGLDSESDDEEI